MSGRTTSGLTIVEGLLVLVLGASVAVAAWQFMAEGTRESAKLNLKTDLMRRARMASLRISREMQEAVEVLHPRLGDTATCPLVVYLNHENETIVLYVDPQKRLLRQNRSKGQEETVLAEDVDAFRSFRKGRRLLNYHIRMEATAPWQPDRTEAFNLISGATLRNNVI